ncbi:MAG: endonuclease [Opitutae bacterium]|nr:endonuclease [Opitutae bacterium]
MANQPSRYSQIIERIFLNHHRPKLTSFDFMRDEIESVADALRVARPKNLGDVIYSFRYRTKAPPQKILAATPAGKEWIIRPCGPGRYRFALVREWKLSPNPAMAQIKVPAATPGIITKYALSDEQALLAILRYNRLVDIFTGVTAYSMQSHLRTAVPDLGQVETDEIYVGVDRQGTHYVLPLQAKGGSDRLSRVQIEQDLALCAAKFPALVCRPLAAQFVEDSLIALFELEVDGDELRVRTERHYRLVEPQQISDEELRRYRTLAP